MSTPASQIYVCKGVPLNNKYDHTFYFATATEQFKYFSSKLTKVFTNYTYIRRTWSLKVGATMDEARTWSYLYFTNATLSNKLYYYFINSVEYINDNTVELFLELDVLQTYMFDWKLNPCYVDREHSDTDFPGTNLIDEGLEVGDYVTEKKETIDLSSLSIMLAATIDINKYYISGGTNEDKVLGSKIDNLFGSFQVTATDLDANWTNLVVLLNYLNEKGKTDTIFTMWEYPTRLIESNTGTYESVFARYVSGSKELTFITNTAPNTLDSYTPKNKKLLQYPYCFMLATNNNGGSAIYKYHDFFAGAPKFSVKGNISPDAVVKLTPMGYKSGDPTTYDYSESLAMSGYPLCSWNNDSYKMWLAQNQNQQNLGFAMSGLKIVGGVAAIAGGVAATGGTGGAAGALGFAGVSSGIGMISSGATEIASQLAQRADKEVTPPQARGSYSGSHNVATKTQNFDIHHKTIRYNQARIIDNYFTMYGYACRRVKVPNISFRPYFNYVKTIGSNVTGDFCMDDIRKINDIFDRGVTFWKSPDIGNYDLHNSI